MKRALPLALLLLWSACSSGELVGIHVALAKDGSGTVTTRSLVDPATPSPAEARSQGVTWSARASLHCAQGRFQQLADLKIGDGGLRFSPRLGDDQPHLRVFVPRGPAVEWVRALVPDQAARRGMAKVYDPTGRTAEIGEAVRIEITVPGEVVASDVHPGGRGVEAAHEKKRAYLIVPVKAALEAGEELVWDVSWR
ncbi:MAG: hypothetical protein FJ265_00605 [Planctomycetes bacterium]|nr:hypothetical protein [Planctomycetota bacterium]